MVSEGEMQETRAFEEEVAGERGKTKIVEAQGRLAFKLKTKYEPRA